MQGSQIQEDEGFKAQDNQYPLHGSYQEVRGQRDVSRPIGGSPTADVDDGV